MSQYPLVAADISLAQHWESFSNMLMSSMNFSSTLESQPEESDDLPDIPAASEEDQEAESARNNNILSSACDPGADEEMTQGFVTYTFS